MKGNFRIIRLVFP